MGTDPRSVKEGVSFRPGHPPTDWQSIVMTLPMWVLIIVFLVFPVIITIQNAFTSATFIGMPAKWIGLEQFRQVISDERFWRSVGRSVVWVLSNVVVQTVAAFCCALVVNRMRRVRGILQTLILLPWIIPTVAAAVVGTWVMNSSYGVLNYLLMKTGLVNSPLNAFGDPLIALRSLAVLNSWHWFPLFFVVILAALQTVPEELYEAASIDGASGWQTFRAVTFPLISRILSIVGLIGTMWSFNVFDTIYLITKGGPADATLTAPVYIYETAFKQFQIGKSAAASVVVMIVLVLYAVIFYRFMIGRPGRESNAKHQVD